jgi:threonine aldolase
LDGARIWNACAASTIQPQEIASHVDSLSVCLSKGLGAPVGSLLIGPTDFIQKAKRIRKALGGGMRQSGVLAAAGNQAITDFEMGILINDHLRASRLAQVIESLPIFELYSTVETNILFISIVNHEPCWDSETISSKISTIFKKNGILVSFWSPSLIRMVIHRDINDADIDKVIMCLEEISNTFIMPSADS